MTHPKRIEPVENLSEQAVSKPAEQKYAEEDSFLESSDARIEEARNLSQQSTSPAWTSPRSEGSRRRQPHGARVLTKRYWQRGEALSYPAEWRVPSTSESSM